MSEETSTPEAQPAQSFSLLASEMFGNDYHGEVSTPEPVAEPAPEPLEATDDLPVEIAEESAELTVEPVEALSDDEPTAISSIQELIESNEFDPEWFNTLDVDVKVDGLSSKVKLSDLVKSHQMTETAEKRLDEAKEKAKTQNQALAESKQKLEQSFQVASTLIQRAEAKLANDVSKIDWADLEKNDPAEWSAQRLRAIESRDDIENLKRDAVSEYQQNMQSNQAENDLASRDTLLAENVALLEKVPEWKDAEVAKKEKTELGEYLIKQGLSQDEVANAYDHRLVVMARKAMRYDAAQGAEPQLKKLTKIPKTLKTGTPKSASETQKIKQQDLSNRLKTSGSIDDAVALLRSRRG